MVKVRIPGLDHSLLEDGRWLPTSTHLLSTHDLRDPRRLPARRKTERLSDSNPNQTTIWDAMAAR